ncbi:MAG: hypothetical protein KIG72_01985 [Bradymonadales bacterium]|nr:hypothetical protein [Bradymonadales bacterium]
MILRSKDSTAILFRQIGWARRSNRTRPCGKCVQGVVLAEGLGIMQ